MFHRDQLKLQAYLDRELTAREAKQTAELWTREPDAQLLLSELCWVKAALRRNEIERAVPQSREAYWTKISHEIVLGEVAREQSVFEPCWLRKYSFPLAALLLIAAVIGYAWVEMDRTHICEVETPLIGTSTITFRDHESRLTVVWLSMSADSASPQDFAADH